ncbi:MAG: hypothetical protein JST27_04700 [Bacteroidetes bacterium]|nr:hypothetical protein [Bacteroidota bacterium]
MRRRFLPPVEPTEAGEILQYIVGGIYSIIQEQFGERDAEIFRLSDAGEKVHQLAISFGLSNSRIKQIIASVERFIWNCFNGDRLRILPLIQDLKSKEEKVELILLAAGYKIDKAYFSSLKKCEELVVEQQPAKTELDKLDLNARSRNALIHHNVTTVEDLCKLKHRDLHFMRGIGPDSINNIKEALGKQGLNLTE